jgi:hypothetical protein
MDIEILRSVLKDQIAKPHKAIINSESAFVQEKLHRAGHSALASAYWDWVCSNYSNNPGFDLNIVELQNQLNQIDRASRQNITVNSRFD